MLEVSKYVSHFYIIYTFKHYTFFVLYTLNLLVIICIYYNMYLLYAHFVECCVL